MEAKASNHFTLAFTECEFLVDFGQAYQPEDTPIVHSRITMTPHSAVTLSGMLGELIRQYETAIGPIARKSAEVWSHTARECR